MCDKCAPPIPVYRMLVHSGFDDAVVCVEAAACDDIYEIMFVGGCLMWNDAVVCVGRIKLKIFVSVWSDMWKSCDVFCYLDVL